MKIIINGKTAKLKKNTSFEFVPENRSESAFITTDKEIFATLHSQVDELISNHSVPLNDLFANKISPAT